MTDSLFLLPANRKLGYATYGPATGFPVVYYYGTPSSRLEPLLLAGFNKNIEGLLKQYDIRFIIPDRPGIGTSDYFEHASHNTFADDVQTLLRHLGVHKAASLSWSGGTPYSFTHAYRYPETVTGIFIFTGFTRSFNEQGIFKELKANKMYFGAAHYFPGITKVLLNYSGKKNSKKPMPRWISQWPQIDYDMLNDESRMRLFSKVTTNESCRAGSRGIVHEARLYFEPSSYDLSQIQQPVFGWWGTEDNVVLPSHYHAIQQQVKQQQIFIKKGEGHFSIYVHFIEEVLNQIVRNINS